jgi:AraC-like DNA-binding protein
MSLALARTSVRLLHPFGAVLEAEGVPLDALLRAAAISHETYDDPDARVSNDTFRKFLIAAATHTRHVALGLEAARQHDRAQFQLLHYLVASSRDLASAVADFVRYQTLIADGRLVQLEWRDEGLLLRYDGPSVQRARFLVEYVVGGVALAVRRALGAQSGDGVALVESQAPFDAWFTYGAAQHAAAYQSFFGPTVRFDAPATGLLIPRAHVTLKPAQANHRVHEILERQVAEQVQRIVAVQSFAERIRALIVDDLADPNANLSRVAAKLRMSRSTLKRQLAAEGQNYTTLLDEARKAAALEYLRRNLSLNEVVFLVGYRDVSAFHRAFRRWTGRTPTEYRKRRTLEAEQRPERSTRKRG